MNILTSEGKKWTNFAEFVGKYSVWEAKIRSASLSDSMKQSTNFFKKVVILKI